MSICDRLTSGGFRNSFSFHNSLREQGFGSSLTHRVWVLSDRVALSEHLDLSNQAKIDQPARFFVVIPTARKRTADQLSIVIKQFADKYLKYD
jgi:hypothetical protein